MKKSLAATAAAQGGAFSLTQSDASKTSRPALRHRVRSGALIRQGKVLVVAGAPPTREMLQWSAILKVGAPCALAGRDAATRHRLPCIPELGDPVVVAVAAERSVRGREGIVVQQIARWDPMSLVDFEGLPVLGARDTILSLAGELTEGHLHAVVQDATYRKLVTLADLAASRRRGLAGSGRLGTVLERLAHGFDSAAEFRAHGLVAVAGFTPHPNVLLIAPDGSRAGPADGYLGVGVAYEIDGRRGHGNARGAARDRRKDEGYQRLDIVVCRVDPADVGARFLTEIRGAVAERSQYPPPNVRIVPVRPH